METLFAPQPVGCDTKRPIVLYINTKIEYNNLKLYKISGDVNSV